MPRWLRFEWFRRRRDYGVLFLRLFIGWFIIWGVQDNMLSHERMVEFETSWPPRARLGPRWRLGFPFTLSLSAESLSFWALSSG